MEAMACGLPIIASGIRGNVDLIDQGKGGWLVAPKDVTGFVSAIDEALCHRERWPQMKEYNLTKVQRYSVEAVVKQMAEIYETVM